jgi:hypothetical protein
MAGEHAEVALASATMMPPRRPAQTAEEQTQQATPQQQEADKTKAKTLERAVPTGSGHRGRDRDQEDSTDRGIDPAEDIGKPPTSIANPSPACRAWRLSALPRR